MDVGDHHFTAYVGPPDQYDFMGATQFRLLSALGLRAHHSLLDFGCGSLRAGRLFISFLDEGRYHGIEPEKWLIDEAIKNQTGEDLLKLKKPQFNHNSDWQTDVFSRQFDFIVAQAVFPRAGSDCLRAGLRSFCGSLKPDGLIAMSLLEGARDYEGRGWVPAGLVSYRPATIRRIAVEAGLYITRIPWYHPRLTWYILARDKRRLPTRAMSRQLGGTVLYDPEFADSWRFLPRLRRAIVRFLVRNLPPSVVDRLQKVVGNSKDSDDSAATDSGADQAADHNAST